MISKRINCSTGPVNISPEVQQAFCTLPLSHRSPQFIKVFEHTRELLCELFSVQQAYIMNGSGTLANEAMLHQLKMLSSKGLILSNGEFGNRLIRQSTRIALDFETYEVAWGQAFELTQLTALLQSGKFKWLLLAHCETSTGVLNNLDAITNLCRQYRCLCFADCISSAGSYTINLSKLAMATASSGKGLAAYSGLAIVLSNIPPVSDDHIPIYFDLKYYAAKGSIPFTVASNQVIALHTSLQQKQTALQLGLIDTYARAFYTLLQSYNVVPFSTPCSKVLTIVLPKEKKPAFLKYLKDNGIDISHESEYLQERDWLQLALFGYYTEQELAQAYKVMRKGLEAIYAASPVP